MAKLQGLASRATSTQLVILTTLVLFVAALVVEGLSHDRFLAGGVLLVLVKLIIGAYKNSGATRTVAEQPPAIQFVASRLDSSLANGQEAGRPGADGDRVG